MGKRDYFQENYIKGGKHGFFFEFGDYIWGVISFQKFKTSLYDESI